jgi:hypothetical protein
MFPNGTTGRSLLCENLMFVRGLWQNMANLVFFLPRHMCAFTWHHSKFHEFLIEFWIYENLETKFLDICGRANMLRCLKFVLISCMWPNTCIQGCIYDFSTHFAAPDLVIVDQIWIMHIKECTENSINVFKSQMIPYLIIFLHFKCTYVYVVYIKKIKERRGIRCLFARICDMHI